MKNQTVVKSFLSARWAALSVFLFFGAMYWVDSGIASEVDRIYVGSEVCGECHEYEYENFHTYAKKAHSYDNIMKMKKSLNEDEFKKCLECHTTGYGRPGGFVSLEQTPHLKNLGCEVCHGPGSLHVESEDPDDIVSDLSIKQCEKCHNAERVADFDYKPFIYGGAH
ncbi:MAG: cytochrome c family protein [Thermodesulfobacteriota bacterium]|nr:cytochrome c family protein [Thermodesulfobacteriota bacterium]